MPHWAWYLEWHRGNHVVVGFDEEDVDDDGVMVVLVWRKKKVGNSNWV